MGIQGICKSAAPVKIDTMRNVDLTFLTGGPNGNVTTGPEVRMGFWEMEDASDGLLIRWPDLIDWQFASERLDIGDVIFEFQKLGVRCIAETPRQA